MSKAHVTRENSGTATFHKRTRVFVTVYRENFGPNLWVWLKYVIDGYTDKRIQYKFIAKTLKTFCSYAQKYKRCALWV